MCTGFCVDTAFQFVWEDTNKCHFWIEDNLQRLILLPQPIKCWSYRCSIPHTWQEILVSTGWGHLGNFCAWEAQVLTYVFRTEMLRNWSNAHLSFMMEPKQANAKLRSTHPFISRFPRLWILMGYVLAFLKLVYIKKNLSIVKSCLLLLFLEVYRVVQKPHF